MVKVRYLDHRPIFFVKLRAYPGGVSLKRKGDDLKVTEGELSNLLKMKNGTMNCFEEIKTKKEVNKIEVDNGSRE